MTLTFFRLEKLMTSLLLALGLALLAWGWFPGPSLSPAPAAAAPIARPKLAINPVTVTLISSKDNTLIESATGALSNGAGDNIFAGRTGQVTGSIRRGVIAFDLSSIPTGSTIISVTLKLHVSNAPTPLTLQPVDLHPLSADWGEGSSTSGGIGAPATPGDATWLHRFYTSTLWATAGGDFDPTTSAGIQVGDVGDYMWGSSQMVTDVQAWLDNPTTNFGWLLQGNEAASRTARGFDSKESLTPANRPALTVNYISPLYLPIIRKKG